MITKDNALLHELIGLDVVVVKSADRDIINLGGKVVLIANPFGHKDMRPRRNIKKPDI